MSEPTEKIGLAKLSFAHVHAGDYARQIDASPDAELVAVWDEEPARGRREAEKRGVPFFERLEDLLAEERVRGVVVDTPTALHPRVLIAAANAGKHIFTEKALTITTADADEVAAAVRRAGVKFMISLPSRVRPEILFAKRVVDDGLLGAVTTMRARIAHSAALDRWFGRGEDHGGSAWFGDEAAAGGGAFFDLGCHRVDVMRWLLGEPASVGRAQQQRFRLLPDRRQHGRRGRVQEPRARHPRRFLGPPGGSEPARDLRHRRLPVDRPRRRPPRLARKHPA
jgi:predicted dehydrogenase